MTKLNSHNIYEAEIDADAVAEFVQAVTLDRKEKAIRLNEAERVLRLVQESGFLPEGGEPAEAVKRILAKLEA